MSKRKEQEIRNDDGTYVVKKNRKMNIIAFVLCFLVAFIIWIYATNIEKKEQMEEQSSNTASEVEAEASRALSVTCEDRIGAEA
ncbi:MAG: hypothetical protein IJW44_00660 [Clostridia bacterium]|nr:hypothetical protein [Clostridia bacterium]